MHKPSSSPTDFFQPELFFHYPHSHNIYFGTDAGIYTEKKVIKIYAVNKHYLYKVYLKQKPAI
jgi:hypothetical protein